MNYRLDIQGLRGIAIAAVVIYHLNPGWLPGGYIGVDVFFVISGFLITTMLRKAAMDKLNLVNFYSSRILRLFPAYLAMLLACAVASYLWLFPIQSIDFGHSLLSAVLFVSNIYFAASINYLSIDAHLLPLLHTWSLSAEAQCYFLFPLILYALQRCKAINTGTVLTVLLVVLFGLNLVLTHLNADLAFFSPTTRLYQFMAGAVLVYTHERIKVSKALINISFILGMMMIFSGFILITPNTNYPGVYSLLPTLGSMLVIFSGSQQQLQLAKLLTNRPLVFLGAISYSLYLWHWPVIVFYKIAINPALTTTDYMSMLGLSILLAILSWFFIEGKFRQKVRTLETRKVITATVFASIIALSISAAFSLTHGLRDRYSDEQLYFAETDFSQKNRHVKITDSCMVYKNWTQSFTEQACVHVSTDKTNILLLGDSHAEHFRRALEDDSHDFSVSVATVSACRPTYPGTGRQTCQIMMQRFYQNLINDYNFDTVIVSARWNHESIERMPDALGKLKASINNVIVVGPIITYSQSLPLLLARQGTDIDKFTSDSKFVRYQQSRAIDRRLKQIAAQAGVDYVSLLDLICPNAICQPMTNSGKPLQWDYGHLTYEGASEIVDKMSEQLTPD